MKSIREALCKDNEITFNLVAITFDKLTKMMEKQESDSLPMMALKTRLSSAIKTRFVLTKYHILATYLTPAFKHVADHWFNETLRDEAMDLLQTLLEVEPESENEDQNDDELIEARNRTLFADYYDTNKVPKIHSEFEHYKKRNFVPAEIKMCPFQFWSEYKTSYPKLSVIATWILCAPATSIASERSFSAAGNTITAHRDSFHPDTVDKLLFARSNLDLIADIRIRLTDGF